MSGWASTKRRQSPRWRSTSCPTRSSLYVRACARSTPDSMKWLPSSAFRGSSGCATSLRRSWRLAPFFAAATRSGLSLLWKIVLVVELMGRPNGVGFEINIAFQLFDVALLLAYALPFTAIMLIIETLLVQPFERHVSRWRPQAA